MRNLLPLFLLAAACGGDDTPDNPDGPPSADAPIVPDGPPTPDAAPDASTARAEGIVIVAEQDTGGGSQSTVGVSLAPGALFGGAVATAGACGYYSELEDAGLSAGVIDITGTLTPVTVTPDSPTPPVSYDNPDLPANLFAPGELLTITAAGQAGGVPAFTGNVTTPDPIAGETLPTAISRAAPPTLTWTAGTGGEMWAWVIALDGSEDAAVLWCRMPDTGTFQLSVAAVALLPEEVTQSLVVLWRTNSNTIPAGDMDVALTAADAVGSDVVPIGP